MNASRQNTTMKGIVPYSVVTLSMLIVCLFLFLMLIHIGYHAWPVVSTEFIFQHPGKGMTEGGIWPAIVGTVMLSLITAVTAVPIGIACAIYLNEYARESKVNQWIRIAIRNLAGIPSIIYGLFGLTLFVQSLQLGTSVLSAGLTLGLLSLPYIITTTEEALKSVPLGIREGSLALGATSFETIAQVVLPAAIPGISTGVVLSLARAAGETAPILFTGAAFYVSGSPGNWMHEFMALPYHLYMLSTQHQAIVTVRPLAYGTAAILILIVFLLNLSAILIRNKYRHLLK